MLPEQKSQLIGLTWLRVDNQDGQDLLLCFEYFILIHLLKEHGAPPFDLKFRAGLQSIHRGRHRLAAAFISQPVLRC